MIFICVPFSQFFDNAFKSVADQPAQDLRNETQLKDHFERLEITKKSF